MRRTTTITQRQRGYTLVELMVSMLIGLILVQGTLMIFNAFNRSVRYQNAVAAQADTGRYAFDRLVRDIRMAGYRDQSWLRPAISDALVAENVVGAPDAITIRYEADVDCAGNATVGPDFLATNRFDVVAGNLRCNGEIIAMGIEDFQILLGEDTDDDGATNRVLAPGTAGLDPTRINSLRIHLLLVSPEQRIQRTAQTFTYFGNSSGEGTVRTYNDGRRRLELATTLALRNPIDL